MITQDKIKETIELNPKISTGDLCNKFNKEPQNIYSAIHALRNKGIQIKSKNGTYWIENNIPIKNKKDNRLNLLNENELQEYWALIKRAKTCTNTAEGILKAAEEIERMKHE